MSDNFRVAEWLVEPQLNTISHGERTVRLEPKVMALLVCLVEHANQVVPKESLMQTIWTDRFVTDEVLTNAVWELRRALGDQARNPRFIQTIPKKGYRLIAPVNAPINATNTAKVEEVVNTTLHLAVRSRWHWSLAATAVLLFITLSWQGHRWWKQFHSTVVPAAALTAYQEGRRLWQLQSAVTAEQALAQFEQARQLAPTYAPAHSGVADAYLQLGCPEPGRHRPGSASEPCVRVSISHGSSITWRLSYAPHQDGQVLWPSCSCGSDDGAVAGYVDRMSRLDGAESGDPLPAHLLPETTGHIPGISLSAV